MTTEVTPATVAKLPTVRDAEEQERFLAMTLNDYIARIPDYVRAVDVLAKGEVLSLAPDEQARLQEALRMCETLEYVPGWMMGEAIGVGWDVRRLRIRFETILAGGEDPANAALTASQERIGAYELARLARDNALDDARVRSNEVYTAACGAADAKCEAVCERLYPPYPDA